MVGGGEIIINSLLLMNNLIKKFFFLWPNVYVISRFPVVFGINSASSAVEC